MGSVKTDSISSFSWIAKEDSLATIIVERFRLKGRSERNDVSQAAGGVFQ